MATVSAFRGTPLRRPQTQPAAAAALARPRPRLAAVRVQASAAVPATLPPAVSSAADLVKRAAKDSSVPPKQVFKALRTLEAAKLQPADWNATIGGPPARRWRLVFVAGAKTVTAANKGKSEGGGFYFPLAGCQRYDASTGDYQNGIFLGRLAALTFDGTYVVQGKILAFNIDTLNLRIGGWKTSFPLKTRRQGSWKREKGDPFFSFFWMSDDFIAARGRSGGIAVWARTTPQWELEKGVV